MLGNRELMSGSRNRFKKVYTELPAKRDFLQEIQATHAGLSHLNFVDIAHFQVLGHRG